MRQRERLQMINNVIEIEARHFWNKFSGLRSVGGHSDSW
jgi:hypothetical protein